MGWEENTSYQHFLLFPKCFQKFFFSGSLKKETDWAIILFYLVLKVQGQNTQGQNVHAEKFVLKCPELKRPLMQTKYPNDSQSSVYLPNYTGWAKSIITIININNKVTLKLLLAHPVYSA